MIEVIAFDGDDTLWHNESVFALTHERIRSLVGPYADPADLAELDQRLYATEMANLKLFGYGVKSFTLSMIETAIELTGGRIPATEIQRIVEAGKDMLAHPIELLDGVAETVEALAAQGDRYRLMLITKGDLLHQESKLDASGLGEHFWRVAIVSEKSASSYRRLLNDYGIDPMSFLMVGNSVPSDILPVVAIGGRAVHVPFHLEWEHEAGEPVTDHDRVWNLDRIELLPALVARISSEDGER